MNNEITNEQLQQLKTEAQEKGADGVNWSMDVGCMFILALIARIESLAAAQVRMCGNSVAPPLAEAVINANFAHEREMGMVAA